MPAKAAAMAHVPLTKRLLLLLKLWPRPGLPHNPFNLKITSNGSEVLSSLPFCRARRETNDAVPVGKSGHPPQPEPVALNVRP